MKTAVIVFALFVAFAAAEDECPLMAALKASFEKCKDSMNPSKETIELVMNGEGSDNRDVQCFQACMTKDAGLMTDAKLDLDKMESLLRSGKEVDETKVQEIMTVMKECKEVAEVTSDECEVSGNYDKCAKSKMPK